MIPPKNVLFLCTGNSARSIFAEAYLNAAADGRFVAYSAGSHPKGEVHPLTLFTLQNNGIPISGLRSKAWDEYAASDAPKMDVVITVCDAAAGEICPIWPGAPVSAHWSFPDPAAVEGNDAAKAHAFAEVLRQIRNRIDAFRNLRLEALDRLALKQKIQMIGQDSA